MTPYDLPSLTFFNSSSGDFSVVKTNKTTASFDRIALHRNMTAFLKNKLPVVRTIADIDEIPLSECKKINKKTEEA